MNRPLIASTLLALAINLPANAQRPPLTAQVKPQALAAARLQVVRAGPASTLPGAAAQDAPAARPETRVEYLSAAAKRDLLLRSGVTGTVAEGVIRADPAPRGTRAFVHVIGAARVANRFPTRAGGTSHTPFAGFTNDPASRGSILVEVEPGGAPRYLVDCGVGSQNQFDVVTGGGTRTQFTLPPAADIEEIRHLRFVLELTSPTVVGGFAIYPREVTAWAFFGCELTPIT